MTKPRDAIVSDLVGSMRRLTMEIDTANAPETCREYLTSASAELRTLLADAKTLGELDDDESESVLVTLVDFLNRVATWVGDISAHGFAEPEEIPGASDANLSTSDEGETQLSIALIDVFRTTLPLMFLHYLTLRVSWRLQLCNTFAEGCESSAERLLLLQDDDKKLLATTQESQLDERDIPNPDLAYADVPFARYFITLAMVEHQALLHRLVMRNILYGDAEELKRAIDTADDIVDFIDGPPKEEPWRGNFLSLDQPVNLFTLLATALRHERLLIGRLESGSMMVSAMADTGPKAHYLIDLPPRDFLSRLHTSERAREYTANPIAFILLRADERHDSGDVRRYRILIDRLTVIQRELAVGEFLRSVAGSPVSRASAVALITWGVSVTLGRPDLAGTITAAVTELLVELLFADTDRGSLT